MTPRTRLLSAGIPVFAALMFTGCSATDPAEGMAKTGDDIAQRAGVAATPPADGDRKDNDSTVNTLLAGGLTADTATRIALLNNRTIRATFEEIGVSQAELDQAGRLPNPTLTASTGWPNERPRGPNVELSLAFDLLDAVLIPLRQRIAEEQFAKAQRRVGHEVLAVVAEVKTAFYEHLAARELCDRLATIADVNDAAAEFAKRQFDAGNINRLEFEQFNATASQARLEVMRADVATLTTREKVNRLLGLSGSRTEWKVAGGLPTLPENEPASDDLEKLAVDRRLDLAAARIDLVVVSKALSLKEDTRLLPAGVTIGVDTERDTDGQRVTGPSLSLGLPIFDQGQAEIARLEAVVRQSRARVEALETDIRAEVRTAAARLNTARAMADFYNKTLLPQRTRLVHETLLQYNAMQKSPFELLASKERQQTTAKEAVEALRDYWLARVELDRTLGGVRSVPGKTAPADSSKNTPPASEESEPMPDMPGMSDMQDMPGMSKKPSANSHHQH